MSYINSNLTNDEQIISSIRHNPMAILPSVIYTIIFMIIGIVAFIYIPALQNELEKLIPTTIISTILTIGMYAIVAFMLFIKILLLIATIVEIKCAELVVTNKRLLGKRGFFSKSTVDIMLSKLDTINANNDFWGGIFHYGAIEIVSAASVQQSIEKKSKMVYGYISNTTEFRKAVLSAIDKAKEEERKAQAEEQAKALKAALNNN